MSFFDKKTKERKFPVRCAWNHKKHEALTMIYVESESDEMWTADIWKCPICGRKTKVTMETETDTAQMVMYTERVQE